MGVKNTSELVVIDERIHRCLDDVDDEVRDRAAMYLRTMKEEALAKVYVKEGELISHQFA